MRLVREITIVTGFGPVGLHPEGACKRQPQDFEGACDRTGPGIKEQNDAFNGLTNPCISS